MASATLDTGTTALVPSRRRMSGSLFESRMAVWGVEAVYVCLLGFLFGKLIWTIFAPLGTPSVMPAPAELGSGADLSILQTSNPFGVVAPVEVSYAEAEETRLNLKLVGTFVSGAQTSATVQGENGRQKLYFVGDEVANGTTIRDVLPDRVILSRSGVTETLSLEGRERMAQAVPPARQATRQPSASASGGTDLLARYVNVQPNPNGAGFAVSAGANRAIFQAAGFQNGDVVVAANGRQLPADLAQAKATLIRHVGRGPVVLTVNRGGMMIDLALDPTRMSQ